MKVVSFQRPEENYVERFLASNPRFSEGTADAYGRALRQFMEWISTKPGSEGRFQPSSLTKTALTVYLDELASNGYSVSHRNRVKYAISSFSNWLIERGELSKNPANGIDVPAQPLMAPRVLTEDQRYILRNLVEREGDPRNEAIFALGFWAGCRVSDVAWLKLEDCSLGPKIGSVEVGYKGGKRRVIDLINEARRPLYEWIRSEERARKSSPYVFVSQRADRLTENGIHHWFRRLKKQARNDEWELIKDITYHDLRHDFAHRCREVGWTLEEIAFYLGHITRKGTPAISTTARYTQPSREQIKEKLKWLKG
ncbi:tyrosine-type recombinase/integrase [Brevibacillus agri]|uniref:tyrosine-type recombinase/integrase n=1 Tax=Brevibacillus agri TaxID=51101 RepID=UPI0018CE9986|nr:hypothetical protein [Brevibacillus agri]